MLKIIEFLNSYFTYKKYLRIQKKAVKLNPKLKGFPQIKMIKKRS